MAKSETNVFPDKESVRRAMQSLADKNIKATTASVYDELPKLFGNKQGNWGQTHTWFRKLKEEANAVAKDSLVTPPSGPLPLELAVTLKGAKDDFGAYLYALEGKLAKHLAAARAEDLRQADVRIQTARIEADRRIQESETEANDAVLAAEQFERQYCEAKELFRSQMAELATVRESLAAEKASVERLTEERDATKEEVRAERDRTETAMAAVVEARAETAAALAEKAKLGVELETARMEATRLTVALEEMTGKVTGLNASLENARIDLATEKARAAQITTDRDAAKKEAVYERERADREAAAASNFRAEAAKLNAELRCILTKTKTYKKKVNEIRSGDDISGSPSENND